MTKLDSLPKKAKSTLFSKKLNFETQKIRPWKNLTKTRWETAVTKRLAKANYRGVGFGFGLSNCTKTLVSYPSPPPPNPPLNSLTFSNNNPIFISIYSSSPQFSLQPSPSLQIKFTKFLQKIHETFTKL